MKKNKIETVLDDKKNLIGNYKKRLLEYSDKLAELQREARDLDIPIVIAVEGWGTSGKGQLINNFILPLDPRGFSVYTIKEESKEEQRYPFLWRFSTKMPEKGRIAIFDRSWYRRVLNDHIDKKVKIERFSDDLNEINNFEKLLTDDGVLLIKLFLHISKDEQTKRLKELLSKTETKWRVTDDDLKHNKQYTKYLDISNIIIENTTTPNANWHVIDANDIAYATLSIFDVLIMEISAKIEEARKVAPFERPIIPETAQADFLALPPLPPPMDKQEYNNKLEYYQDKLSHLHNILYLKKIPLIIVFEGFDAAGKGGAIQRLTTALDPRGYQVFSTPAPTPTEKAHHYLWRFWNATPKTGHIAIFDRSWYGRVLVEPIEGFCSQNEYERAFDEINNMEKHLVGSGIIILKFFINISKDEQLVRFEERKENPKKAWKLTSEDFRNREKWEQYITVAERMLDKTNTKRAPWHIVFGDSKKHARLEILKIIYERLAKI